MIELNISIDPALDRVYVRNGQVSLQLSQREFNILMEFPTASETLIAAKFYELDKSAGRRRAEKIVHESFVILGRAADKND